MRPIRALGLLSGGLDSAIAARLLKDQGVDVVGLHLRSPTACRSDVREVARDLGIDLEVRDKGAEYLRLLRHPRYGYGRNMNPCVDCRIFMFQIGLACMEELGASFLFTGEVVGQRPMSQLRDRLDLIDRRAGLEGLLLRPLSARLLPETEPERRGWVDRTRLEGISGRGRDRQLALAREMGLKHYTSPGGGCLLTDASFSQRLRDLFEHQSEERTREDDVALLRLGRHCRIRPDLKIILGRDEAENLRLLEFEREGRWCVQPHDFAGPTALVCGDRDADSLAAAMELIARHSRGGERAGVVSWREADGVHLEPLRRESSAGAARSGLDPR